MSDEIKKCIAKLDDKLSIICIEAKEALQASMTGPEDEQTDFYLAVNTMRSKACKINAQITMLYKVID